MKISPEMKNDLLFAATLLAAVTAFIAAAMLGKAFLNQREGLKLQSKAVVTIPLTEINACHDRKGVIRVKDGKWTCEAEK